MPGGIHPPAAVFLAWPKPNYINPELRDWSLGAAIVILLSLTVTIVCARLWARIIIQRNAGIDDTIIVIAMVCNSDSSPRLVVAVVVVVVVLLTVRQRSPP
jgi:hypothetical protein